MPLAVTHVLLTIILVDLYRDYFTKHKKYFTLHTVLIAGIAGLLPDLDLPLNWLFNNSFELLKHGGITHTPFFGLIFLIPAFYFWHKKQHRTSVIFFVITFGVLFHLFLDILLGGGAGEGSMIFWPLSNTAVKVHLLGKIGLTDLPAALDAFILLAWLVHEEIRHKIRDFV